MLDLTIAAGGAQGGDLGGDRVDQIGLERVAGCQRFVERAGMPVATALHLGYERLMPEVEGAEFAPPPECFGMPGVAGPAIGEHRPDSVQLAMLAQQVRSAEAFR